MYKAITPHEFESLQGKKNQGRGHGVILGRLCRRYTLTSGKWVEVYPSDNCSLFNPIYLIQPSSQPKTRR